MSEVSLGLNGAVIPQADLETGIRAASEAGFAYYEPRLLTLQAYLSLHSLEKVKNLRLALGIEWLPLNALEVVIFPADPTAFWEKAEALFDLAASFGIPTVILVPAKIPQGAKEADIKPQAEKAINKLIALAGLRKVGLALEMLGFPNRMLNRLKEARKFISRDKLPLVLDTFHLTINGTTADEIEKLSPEEIALVHVSDALVSGKPVEELIDEDRVLPDDGELPLLPMMKAIKRTGYRGVFSVEVFHPRYKEQDPFKVAKEAYLRLVALLREAGWEA